MLFCVVENGGAADKEEERKADAVHPEGIGARKPQRAVSGTRGRDMRADDEGEGKEDGDEADGNEVRAARRKGTAVGADRG